MKKSKRPLIISVSLLGLTVAMTGCATSKSNQSTNNPEQKMMQHHQSADTRPDFDNRWGKPQHDEMMQGHKKHRQHQGFDKQDFDAQLNLTEAQKKQIEQLKNQNKAKIEQLHSTLKQFDDNIAKQKQAGASDATLLSLHKQKQETMQQFFVLRQQERQQFLNILTPEQQLKFYENRNHRGKDSMKR